MDINMTAAVTEKEVNQRHNSTDQELYLSNLPTIWKSYLQFKDWKLLKMIRCNNCQINDIDLKVFTDYEWPNMEELGLSQNNISGQGVKILMRNSWFRLARLWIDNNKLDREGLNKIFQSDQQFPSLKQISLINNKLNWMSISKMPQFGLLKNFVKIYLNCNPIGSRGAKTLSKIDMPNLQELWLSQCELNDCGVKFLGKFKWPKLKTLMAGNNKIGWDGIQELRKFNLQSVISFDTYQNQFPSSVIYLAATNATSNFQINCYLVHNFQINHLIVAALNQRFYSF